MSPPEIGPDETSNPPASLQRDRFVYRPASWFEPLDLETMFSRRAPVEVELGSGDGSFLIAWARHQPDRDFIGIERLLGRLRKLDRKAQRAGLANVRGLRIEAAYAVEYLLPPAGVAALHVYFPDPWPKRRHHKNRLVTERFPALVERVLQPGGQIHLRTDNAEYYTQMQRVFAAAPGFRGVETPADLVSAVTDFERGFLRQGVATLRASYQKR
jgi:tRNA (guanine-N7-)-methyltransferase